MAIIIPSKHIYEVNNQKINNNQINRIEYSEKQVDIQNTEGTAYSDTISSFDYSEQCNQDIISKAEDYFAAGYIIIGTAYIKQCTQTINTLVKVLQDGVAFLSLGEARASLYVKVVKGKVSAINNAIIFPSLGVTNNLTEIEFIPTYTSDGDMLLSSFDIETKAITFLSQSALELSKTIKEETPTATISSSGDSVVATINGLVGCLSIAMQGDTAIKYEKDKAIEQPISLIGDYAEYIPTRLVLSVGGEKLSLNIDERDLVEGNGDDIYNIKANSFIQSTNTPPIANSLAKVIKSWEKGKEVITLVCGIADYYDESGNKIIDINSPNMSFVLHQVVSPYVYTYKGIDEPISLTKDGSPKQFEVISSKVFYEGVPLQEIVIREVNT